MDAETRKYIKLLAEWVISTYNISIPITNIRKVVEDIGGQVEERYNFDNLCDGTIKKEGEDSFKIVISKLQNKQRESFTIAHELGHLFLHMGYRTSSSVWEEQDSKIYRRFGTSEQEYQANEFAAELLMPEVMYKEILMKNIVEGNKVDISKVADYFKVSNSAARNRGRFLGYIK